MTSHARPRRPGGWAVPAAVAVLLAGVLTWLVVSSTGSHSPASARPGTAVVLASGSLAGRGAAPITLTAVPPGSILVTGAAGPRSAALSRAVPPAGAASTTDLAPTPSAARSTEITYTVRPGDNLTVIAVWFHQHGYQPIYDWNRTVIGRNPDLIKPGQVFIVAIQATP